MRNHMHGAPLIYEIVQVERCLAQACTPLLEMICCWLFEGRLSSAAGDFFIVSNPLPNGMHELPPGALGWWGWPWHLHQPAWMTAGVNVLPLLLAGLLSARLVRHPDESRFEARYLQGFEHCYSAQRGGLEGACGGTASGWMRSSGHPL